MNVEIIFENIMFHEAVNIPHKTNCYQCGFDNYGLCMCPLKEIINKCDRGEHGYWNYKGVERRVIND